MNSNLSDIADGLSDCLTTDGQSTMTGQLKGSAGTETAPGYTFATDPNTGIYRKGADNLAITVGGSDAVDITSTGIDVTGTIKQNGNTLLPPGLGPLPWAGATAPAGWLLCYGQSLLRTAYADLFTAIGTTYGAADGTHFSLPDMRGRVVAGDDNMGGVAAGRLTSTTMTPDGVTLGAVGGSQTHELTQSELSVDLGTATSVVTDPGHIHAIPQQSGTGGSSVTNGGLSGSFSTNTDSNTTGITVDTTITNASGGNAHNNVQPTIITNYIIFAGV